MKLTIQSNWDGSTVDVTRVIVGDPRAVCSSCDERKPQWRMSDVDTLAVTDLAKTPLHGPDTCEVCLNQKLQDDDVTITRVDGEVF